MNKKDAKKWANALRSGKYIQSSDSLLKTDNGYCCLGVACEVFGIKPEYKFNEYKFEGESAALPESLKKRLRFVDSLGNIKNADTKFSRLNDAGIEFEGKLRRLTFDEIADVIELVYIHNALD